MGLNTWCHSNSVSFKSHFIRVTFKICTVLGAQIIRATGFRHAQGNQHCAKFESHTRVTIETNAISITSSIHTLNVLLKFEKCVLSGRPSFLMTLHTYLVQKFFFKNHRFFSFSNVQQSFPTVVHFLIRSNEKRVRKKKEGVFNEFI